MQETLIDIKNRRSCRKYTDEQITPEQLNAVLEAGTWAASGHGQQSAKMVVTQDPALISELSRLNAEVMGTTRDPFYGAPTVVMVFADKTSTTGMQDATLVMGNLMLAAHAVGLGSCWINRGKQMFELPEGEALLKIWNLGEQYEGLALCILGNIAEGGTVVAKNRKDDYITFV